MILFKIKKDYGILEILKRTNYKYVLNLISEKNDYSEIIINSPTFSTFPKGTSR